MMATPRPKEFFNIYSFKVEFFESLESGGADNPKYEAAFNELDGLELTMEPKTIREGGNNMRQIHLAGTYSYAQLSLKRGMSRDVSLWRWFQQVMSSGGRGIRYDARITMQSSAIGHGEDAERKPNMIFKVYRCLPTRVRAPAFNALEGTIAIEEMTLVYEAFDVDLPKAEGA